jgi:hypothetical protein
VAKSPSLGKSLLTVSVLLPFVGAYQPAWAAFGPTTPSGQQSVSAGVLQPPTGLAAAQGPCANNRSTAVALSWKASTSAFAAGYAVWRSGGGSAAYVMVGTAGGGSATGFTDTTVAFSTTYSYVVRAARAGWTSAAAGPVAITTLSKTCH